MRDLKQQLGESATAVRARHEGPIDAAIILGSGLGDFAECIADATVIDYDQIPYFEKPHVAGHAGRLVIGKVAPGFTVACMQGRFHYYEGHEMESVVYPVRMLRYLGISTLVVTNAAGGINPNYQPGQLMLIRDHLNLMGTNPLRGRNHDFLGPRFPDMTEAYSKPLRALAQAAANKQGVNLAEGVYAAMSGPTYETPAEVQMAKTLGADAVGMSTVPEVIAANHMGMEVLGISCITNLAAGISAEKLSHTEVIETTERVKGEFVRLLTDIFTDIAAQPAASRGVSLPVE